VAHPRGGAARLQPPPPTPKLKFRRDLVNITISNVVCDLPFSGNHPLKSADDCYIRILKNKLIRKEDRTLIECWNM
jgi:hypothetical protein